jgi:drug/metabolite transporter (DMT)-like permease
VSPVARAQVRIHVCVLLWGFTPILGKLITLSPASLVLWRMILVVAALSLVPRVWRGWIRTSRKLLAAYALTGFVVAMHWLAFYASIKWADASVAATCLALAPVFLAFIEPLATGRRFDPRELFLGVAVVPGVALVVGGMPAGMHLGFLAGVVSALLAALFNACNKRLAGRADPLMVTHVEIGAGALFLACVASMTPHTGALVPVPSPRDAALLVVLSGACTLLPFTLALMALEHLSAFSAQLAVNLEPVYAVLLAIVLFGEQRELGLAFYAGLVVILAAVVAQPMWLVVKARSARSQAPGSSETA